MSYHIYFAALLAGRDSSVGMDDSLRAGRSSHRIPVEARFHASALTGPGTPRASYKMGTGSLSRG